MDPIEDPDPGNQINADESWSRSAFAPVFQIYDIFVWIPIRIRGAMPLTNGSDPDPGIFIIDFQDATKKLIF